MERKLIQIKNDKAKQYAIRCLHELQVDPDKPVSVEILPWEKARTKAQNRLYWKHIGEIAAFRCRPDEDIKEVERKVHYDLKRRYLHPILMMSTNQKAAEYQSTYAALCLAEKAGMDHAEIKKLHAELLSTTKASTAEMRQYIDSYWADVNHEGCYLTNPEEMGL